MNLSIIIPVFEEAENIQKAIFKIEKEVRIPHQTFIVYDFDQDNTIPVVKKLQKKISGIKLLKNNIGDGRGVINAIKTGFNHVKDGAIVVTMADLSDDPKTINQMYQKIKEGFDLVCGSRYSPGGGKIGGPFLKSFLSRLAGLSTPLFLGVPTFDLTNAFKMYKKKVIEAIKIESKGGFELSMEIVIKAHFKGFKLTEVPTVWQDRTKGKSRFKFRQWLPKYIHWYLWGIKRRLKLN